MVLTRSVQGRRKQSPDGQAQLDVGSEAVNHSRVKRVAKIWTLVFLAVRRCSHWTSAPNWDSKAWKFSHTERKSYACTLRYVPAKFYYSNLRPHKCRTRNYVSTSADRHGRTSRTGSGAYEQLASTTLPFLCACVHAHRIAHAWKKPAQKTNSGQAKACAAWAVAPALQCQEHWQLKLRFNCSNWWLFISTS